MWAVWREGGGGQSGGGYTAAGDTVLAEARGHTQSREFAIAIYIVPNQPHCTLMCRTQFVLPLFWVVLLDGGS